MKKVSTIELLRKRCQDRTTWKGLRLGPQRKNGLIDDGRTYLIFFVSNLATAKKLKTVENINVCMPKLVRPHFENLCDTLLFVRSNVLLKFSSNKVVSSKYVAEVGSTVNSIDQSILTVSQENRSSSHDEITNKQTKKKINRSEYCHRLKG